MKLTIFAAAEGIDGKCYVRPSRRATKSWRGADVPRPKWVLFGSDSSWFPRDWLRDVFGAQIKAPSPTQAPMREMALAILCSNLRRLFKR